MGKLVVIDTDAGVDDALAIFVAISAHQDPAAEFRILGITCVAGNTDVDNVCQNVTRILHTADVAQIPVFRGSEIAMVVPYQSRLTYHGNDGFGDLGLPKLPMTIEEAHAVMALIRFSKTYPGELSILALGPLTNIALAARLDPGFGARIKAICLMGGNIEPVQNPTFNFKADPEAAFVVLTLPCSITVVPYETCKRENFKKYRENELGAIETPQMVLLNQIEVENLAKDVYSPCDPMTAAVLINPQIVTCSKDLRISVELGGSHSRGLMLIDTSNSNGGQKNANVVYEIDAGPYLLMLRNAVR